MQRRNLILHRPSDNIWLSRAVQHYKLFSVSVISWHSPHCRPPNNTQLFFLAFLKDTDCCKNIWLSVHLQRPHCDSLTSLTYFLHSCIISIHPESVKVSTDLSYICPPTHPQHFSNFANKSGRSSAADSSIYSSLIPSRGGVCPE